MFQDKSPGGSLPVLNAQVSSPLTDVIWNADHIVKKELWSRGQNEKKIVPLHPLGRKTPLLPCIRYTSLVLGKPCLTKISVVSFSLKTCKVRYHWDFDKL